ncbi:MAG: hypothetical protein J2P16_14835 [Mycobacterium sp.]|nr:hypothetical protein [Mycobacterium sp.]
MSAEITAIRQRDPAELWETVLRQEGPDSDFTNVVKPLEAAAGVIVDGRRH